MKTAIYYLSDPRTGIVKYVGKANNPNERVNGHRRQPCSEGMKRWIADLLAAGVLPVMNVLEWVDEQEWRDREKFWIAHFRSGDSDILNVSDGGDGVFAHTEGVRKIISESSKARVFYAESRKKKSISLTGKKKGPMPEDQKRRISATMSGIPKGESHRLAVIEAITGKKRSIASCERMRLAAIVRMTPDVRAKISKTLTGKGLSEETKKKLSVAHKGKIFTAEHLANIRAASKRRYAKLRGEIDFSLSRQAMDEFEMLLSAAP